jgi:hypothetical protein
MLVPDSSSGGTPKRSRPERPPPCLRCEAPSWWNGWREVFVVVGSIVDGHRSRCERCLPRAKCTICRHSFTCYPPGHYPHRQYQLDIVGEVVAAIAIGAEGATKAVAPATASPASGRRWTAWVAQLAAPAALLAVAQRLDPGAPVGAGISTTESASDTRSLAAHVLDALEHLGAALVRRGVDLASRTGLGRVLEWQPRLHRDVVYLVAEPRCLSPAMALGPTGGGL